MTRKQKLAAVLTQIVAFAGFTSPAFAATITLSDPQYGATNIDTVIKSGISAIIVLAALIALVMLILGGINWMTSGGDKQKTEEAQKRITNAIIGLAIVAAAWAIYRLLLTVFLGGGVGNSLELPSFR